MRVAAERPYHRLSPLHADREAGRECVLAAALVTTQCITVKLLNVSQSE